MKLTQEDMLIIQEKFPSFNKIQQCMVNNSKYGIALSKEAEEYLNERKNRMDENAKMNQKERIIAYLSEHESITGAEAYSILSIKELSARICELEKDGWEFQKVAHTGKNKYCTFRYIEYSLVA